MNARHAETVVSSIELAPLGGMHLWLVDLEQAAGREDLSCLSTTEAAKANRFVFPLHRQRYVVAHIALRKLLGQFTSQPADTLDIRETPLGKPYLAGDNACAFNLSHSNGIGLIAIAAGGDLGVDVEVMRAMPDARALSAEIFTASERQEFSTVLEAPNDELRDSSFLHGWTRKEACLKAVGVGLGIRPDSFQVGLAPQRRIVAVPSADRLFDVELHSFSEPASFVAAVAVIR